MGKSLYTDVGLRASDAGNVGNGSRKGRPSQALSTRIRRKKETAKPEMENSGWIFFLLPSVGLPVEIRGKGC